MLMLVILLGRQLHTGKMLFPCFFNILSANHATAFAPQIFMSGFLCLELNGRIVAENY